MSSTDKMGEVLGILRAERWAALEDAESALEEEHRDYLMAKASALSTAIDELVAKWTGTRSAPARRRG